MSSKRKIKVIKIKFTPAQQEEIDLINKGQIVPTVKTRIDQNGIKRDIVYNKRFTFEMARKRLRELYSGICSSCGAWPVYIVSRDVSDKIQKAQLIERYCQNCFDEYQERISK